MQIKLHDFFLGSSFPPRLTGLEWRAFFINNSKTIKGIRLIFSGLIEVHKVYLQCKAWLSSYCSFCVILNSMKVRHFRPFRRYVYFLFIYFILSIDIFFGVDSKSTIGFQRSHVVFELWRFKIIRKNDNFLV